MKKNPFLVVIISLLIVFLENAQAQVVFDLFSPDEKIVTHIKIADNIEFEVLYDSLTIIEYSEISINIDDELIGHNPKIKKKITNSINKVIYPEVPEKNSRINDNYNDMQLYLKGNVVIYFRAYNNGFAWRFETNIKEDITVHEEGLHLNLPQQSNIWFPEESSFFSHNERYYLHLSLDSISSEMFCSLPALVESANDVKILVTESNLQDYPGMWLQGTGENRLKAIFPGVALEEEQSNDRDVKVTKYADFLAKTFGTRVFPWRILAIAENDGDLITNQLSYLLADHCAIEDPFWIKPGKVAWDWWNAWNIYGVDFKAGVNTETYKYYIDFASEYSIEYIIMDEGWYVLGDLMNVVPEIDMEEILNYADSKNVGVILWVIWKTLEDQWEEAFDQFEKWGVKGITGKCWLIFMEPISLPGCEENIQT
jgi:alpha-glucosidase